jgi:spore germination cell wall hydrolase CwlJ-like protein
MKRRRHSHRPIYILLTIIIILGFAIIGNQNDEAIRDKDILDKLNLIDQSIDTTAKNRSQVNLEPLTLEERKLIERIVMSESGGESLEAQIAVTQTLYDRMNDFGDTLQEAVETYSQNDNGEPTDSVKLAVENVFDRGMRIYEGGTYQFHDDTVNPYWTEGKVRRGNIGNLRFYGGYENEI